MKRGLTKAERKVVEGFGTVYAHMLDLPTCHPSDANEARLHIHALQNMVLARAAVRAYPDDYTHDEDFE